MRDGDGDGAGVRDGVTMIFGSVKMSRSRHHTNYPMSEQGKRN